MASEKGKSGGGKIVSWIVTIVILAALGVFAYKKATAPPSDPILIAQQSSEGALKIYAQHADDFLTKDIDFNYIKKCVTKEDYQWFQDNYKRLNEDFLNISGGLHPVTGDALARVKVMRAIVKRGPHRKDIEIIEVNESGNGSEILIRQLASLKTKEEFKVRLIKEGKYWKMRDFGGGRQLVQGDPLPTGKKKYVRDNGQPAQAPSEQPQQAAPRAGIPAPGIPPGLAAAQRPQQPAPQQTPAPTASPRDDALAAMQAVMQSAQTPIQTPASQTPALQLSPQEAAAKVDQLVNQANTDWQAGRLNDALTKARQALELSKKYMGDQHPKTIQVQGMVNAAEKQLQNPSSP